MAEQAQQESTSLSAVVADAAYRVALALEGERGSHALSGVLAQDDAVAVAAVRVLGADVLAPYALHGAAAGGGAGESVVRKALAAYPPGADASEVSVWTYRGLVEASRTYLPGGPDTWPEAPRAGTQWVAADPWPTLSYRVSQLAALTLPGLAPELAAALAPRTEDLSRGFVRAVRRRDWLQSAGLGRWLSRLPDVPETLGLDAGLRYVHRMGEGDARVVLHVTAARRLHGRGA